MLCDHEAKMWDDPSDLFLPTWLNGRRRTWYTYQVPYLVRAARWLCLALASLLPAWSARSQFRWGIQEPNRKFQRHTKRYVTMVNLPFRHNPGINLCARCWQYAIPECYRQRLDCCFSELHFDRFCSRNRLWSFHRLHELFWSCSGFQIPSIGHSNFVLSEQERESETRSFGFSWQCWQDEVQLSSFGWYCFLFSPVLHHNTDSALFYSSFLLRRIYLCLFVFLVCSFALIN